MTNGIGHHEAGTPKPKGSDAKGTQKPATQPKPQQPKSKTNEK